MKRGFTLMELIVAVLLGTMIMLMIAGGLQSAIRSWERVQERVGVNYNRRSVLDLVKRQASSIFYREDANELDAATLPGGRGGIPRRNNNRNRDNEGPARTALRGEQRTNTAGFHLPDGASFFYGNVQELSFISSVSFLSDFPGQVAVRYYVVQGDPGDGEIGSMPSSRTPYDDDMDDQPMEFGVDEEPEPAEELEGDLYLVLEEQNLFLASTMEDDSDDEFVTDGEDDMVTTNNEEFNERSQAAANAAMGMETTVAEVESMTTMKILGPLRRLVIRYRRPGLTDVEDANEDDRWAQTWDIDRSGGYPSAIEISIAYEPEDLETEEAADVPLEELDNVRMMIPVYDSSNLARGAGGSGTFGGSKVMGAPSRPDNRGGRNREGGGRNGN